MVATTETRVPRDGAGDPAQEPTAAAPAPAPARPAVEYERDGPGGRVSVRGFRLLIGLTLVNTVLLASSVLGPQLFPFVRGQWQQLQVKRAAEKARQAQLALKRQCLNHTLPDGTVVYEEDPQRGITLAEEGGGTYVALGNQGRIRPPGWVPPTALKPPPYYTALLDAMYGARVVGAEDPVLFLHERKTPAGVRYLVCVRINSDSAFDVRRPGEVAQTEEVVYVQEKRRVLSASAWPADKEPKEAAKGRHHRLLRLAFPDSNRHHAARVRQGAPAAGDEASIDYGNRLRFFAGTPDPTDPTRFIVPFDVDGRRGTIEGQLKNDGVDLRSTAARWVYNSDGEGWDLTAGPATKPAAE